MVNPEIGSKWEVLGGRAGRLVLGTVVSATPYQSPWHWHPSGEWRRAGWMVETSIPELESPLARKKGATYTSLYCETEWRGGIAPKEEEEECPWA